MADQQGGQVEKIDPEDPQYTLEDHVLFKRKQESITRSLKEALQSCATEFELIMDGTTFAYTKMDLANRGIKQMNQQIWQYSHLRKLDLSFNRLQNINALIKLKYLVSIDLGRNILQDVKFLSDASIFPYVKSINLSGNRIQTLPRLELKNLNSLNLNYNVICTLEDFQGHEKLEKLELRGNKLKTLTGLKKLPVLKQLYIAQNQLQDLKGIEYAPRLVKIHARKNKISRLQHFPDLKGLKYLNLRENSIAKVDDVASIGESVQELNLMANPVSEELGDNVKKEVFMRFRHYQKINKSEITPEEKEEFDKQYKDRLAQQERERQERQTAEKEAAEQAEREAAEQAAQAQNQ